MQLTSKLPADKEACDARDVVDITNPFAAVFFFSGDFNGSSDSNLVCTSIK